MAATATVTTVAAFALVGPWAVLYLAMAFTLVVFATLALIIARHAFCRRSFGEPGPLA